MRWKLALAQHPMYLLIREDTQCAERTPPWGAPDITAYIDRVRQNLGSLEKYPQLKLGYEWSGVELELLSQDDPEALQEMVAWARAKRVQFYNGTYAQPHLQILSSEANFRQFEVGLKVYQEAGLPAVLTYAHQEASVHDQVPQLLNAFGIRFAAVPGFLSTLAWLNEGELVLHGVRGPRFVQGHEFVSWQALDGSQVPLYLHQPIPREFSLEETLAREEVLGKLRVPPVLIDMPDMIPIDEAWIAERKIVDFVLLGEILEERLKKCPPRSRARLYTHWSYLEGIRAEELSRRNTQAEQAALQAEALATMESILLDRAAVSLDETWKTILAAQHHDVYCFSAPELRDKAIGWLEKAEQDARNIARQAAGEIGAGVDTRGPAGGCVIVFNTAPHSQTGLVEMEIDLEVESPAILNAQCKRIPAETLPLPSGQGARVRFVADLRGFGYQTYWIGSGGEASFDSTLNEPFTFENPFYRACVYPDGTLESLIIKPGGEELLDPAQGRGNRLTATDSTALSLKEDSSEERAARYTAELPLRGPALVWEPCTPASLIQSPLGARLSVEGRLGDRIQASAVIDFYHRLPRIDLEWRFNFNQASIGTFFDDDSKLLVHWPLGFTGQISHDIPFGAVSTLEERSFFPTSWVDISDGEKGLAFFHLGTPHYWVSGGCLVNLLAWGEDTDAIHNGLGRYRWLKSFDQRLNGAHTIRNAIYIHRNDWQEAGVVGMARSFRNPFLTIPTNIHQGVLPAGDQLLRLENPGLASTAIFTRGSQVVCRAYAADGRVAADGGVETKHMAARGLHSLSGDLISELKPFQIGEIYFERV